MTIPYYDQYDDNTVNIHGDWWCMQSFTPDTAFSCPAWTLWLAKVGIPNGTLTYALYNADGNGNPVNPALASATVSYAGVGTDYPGTPTTAMFASPVALLAATQYCMITHLSGGDEWACLRLTYKMVGSYAGGKRKASVDGGATWIDTVNDLRFAAWAASTAPVFVSPNVPGTPGYGIGVRLANIGLFSVGSPSGISDDFPAVLTVKDSDGDTICSKTYNTGNPFPTNGYSALGSGLNYGLSAQSPVYISVARCGATALPEFWVMFTYLRAGNKMCSGARVAAMSA
ncbi:MAG: hypothetical protein NTZ17_17820 [Phycisphaerae bacterium]|nr:hypothetical protein [Phycisphaerae bacterium]